jgi:hypothetical protein
MSDQTAIFPPVSIQNRLACTTDSKLVLRVVKIELFKEVWNDFSLQISNVIQNQKIHNCTHNKISPFYGTGCPSTLREDRSTGTQPVHCKLSLQIFIVIF